MSELRAQAAPEGLPAEVQTLVDAAWRWGKDCEVDGIPDQRTVGDSHNEGQREDVLKAAVALKSRLDDRHGQAEVARLRHALQEVVEANSRSTMRKTARLALQQPTEPARAGTAQAVHGIDPERIGRAAAATLDMAVKSPFWTSRDEQSVRRALQHLCGLIGIEGPPDA